MLEFLYTIIIYPLVLIIELVFVFTQKMFKETGLSIICVSAVVSVLCLPLYMVAEKWQEIEREIVKKLKPKVEKFKKSFNGDEQYMILSTFYRQNNYHPIYALRSSFGLLIQIPFFIAAYSYLSHLGTLNGASFLFIKNLGAPDSLIPIASGINLLPLIMTFINLSSGVIYSHKFLLKDKLQLYFISLLFLVLLYNSPSGLVLYWTLNNIFSLIKNIYFKIPLKSKKYIIYSIISFFCAVFIYYILFILRRDINLKIVLSFVFLIVSVIPWLLPFVIKTAEKIKHIEYSNKNAFLIFIISMLSICIMCGILIPGMLISSSQEFSNIDTYKNPLYFIYNTFIQTLGFFIFWPLCLYFLFSSKVKYIFSLFGITLCFIIICNIFIFSGNYGLISIELIFDGSVDHNFKEIIINISILLIIFIIIALLFLKTNTKVILPLIILPLIALLSVSFININKINYEYKKTQAFYSKKQSIEKIEPLFNLSKTGKNTVIIMLDRATSGFLPFIFEESPDLNNIYSGFTYYPNTVSFNGYTRLGAPPLFGGYEYTPKGFNLRNEIPMRQKHNEALLLLPRIFSEAGYEAVITDPPYPNYSYRDDFRIFDEYPGIKAYNTKGLYTEYWLKENNWNLPSISDILKRNIFLYSFFRVMPYAFRAGIYQHGDWFAPYSNYKYVTNLNSYSVLDYLPRLTGFNNKKENTFLFLANETTHDALHYQAPDFRPNMYVSNYGTSPYGKENEYHTNIGALKRIGDWINFLKHENVYDNTRIIIVSDHGAQLNYVLNIKLPFNLDNVNPLLLVKDFNSSGSLKTDMTFMSNADVPFLAVQNQIDNAVNPWTGKLISNNEKDNPLYIAFSGGVHLGDPNSTLIMFNPAKDYYVKENIFIESNWKRADE